MPLPIPHFLVFLWISTLKFEVESELFSLNAVHEQQKVWYGAVLRGDKSRIEIGLFSNIQEGVVINTVPELKSGFSPVCEIGSYVSVGHGSRLTSCLIENYVSIGQGCIIPEGNK